MKNYAIILTHNRPTLLYQCVQSIIDQVDMVIIVDNASNPSVNILQSGIEVIRDPEQPPNIAKMWNQQINRIAEQNSLEEMWNIALLCDDTIIPPYWYIKVSTAMRDVGVSAASTHSYAPISSSYRLTSLTNGADRMCPWAFMIAGESRLRADESLHWWYCDTDLDWQARVNGGTLIVDGPIVPNERIGEYTQRPELSLQAKEDERTFYAKWFGK